MLQGDEMSRLENLRKARGFSQSQVQNLTGIDRSNYSKIERGRRSLTLDQCVRLALALDSSIDYLLGRTDDPAPYLRASE